MKILSFVKNGIVIYFSMCFYFQYAFHLNVYAQAPKTLVNLDRDFVTRFLTVQEERTNSSVVSGLLLNVNK